MDVPYIKKCMHAEEYQPYKPLQTVKFHSNRLRIYYPPLPPPSPLTKKKN